MSSLISNRIRFLSLDRTFREHSEQYLEAVSKALESGIVVGGPEVERFESRIAERSGRRHAIAVTSGTDAMMVLLMALGVRPEWSVLVPAYSFVATASPLLHRGVDPIFVDVDDYYHLDLGKVSQLRSADGLNAMIIAGLFGSSMDYGMVEKFCADSNRLLIEDAAQSFGAHFKDRPGGNLGLASTFSFAPTKTLPCFGNFGAVVTDDAQLAERIRRVRYHGRSVAAGQSEILGWNSLPVAVCAAMLNVSLDHFDENQQRRDRIAEAYFSGLRHVENLQLPLIRPGAKSTWHKYVVRHPDRDGLRRHLDKHGIETQVHYPTILPDSAIFTKSDSGSFQNARRLARESLTLPLHSCMSEDEIGRVINGIETFGDN